MRSYRFFPLLVLLFLNLLVAPAGGAQQLPQRDPQALYLLVQSVSIMGGDVPSSSLAVGTVELVEGSLTEAGAVRTLTRGLEQTQEEIQTSRGLRARVYSNGRAANLTDTGIEGLSLEMAQSSQSPNFPLVLIASALNNPDFAFVYLGQENFEGSQVHHIRFWNTYASDPRFQHLAEFSVKDLWIDAASGLPRKLSYDQREAAGNAPSFRIEAYYSDYRDIGGVLYPFLIERSFNGTPWATIKIDNVVLNADLSDADFPTQ